MQRFATITVIGRDKTGVVARITNFLFLQKANIEALEEQVTRGQFSMTVQTSWKERDLDRHAVGQPEHRECLDPACDGTVGHRERGRVGRMRVGEQHRSLT